MGSLRVDYSGGIGFRASARGHVLNIDLPVEKGGQDKGMTPPELFISSLGSCIGVYVVRYCQTAGLNSEGLGVDISWELSEDKTMISKIDVELSLPNADVGKRANAVLSAAHRCLLHNTIQGQPDISLKLA